MQVYVFDMDGTLTFPRKKMEEHFAKKLLPWLKENEAYIATGSDINKVKEQLQEEIINAFTGIFCDMGNSLWAQGICVGKRDFEVDQILIEELEKFRKNTLYPYTLFPNYIEKRIGAINFSILGRDCPYVEREKYSSWDSKNKERENIQKLLSSKYKEYDFLLGGSISIDIVKKGFGKEQIAKELRKLYKQDKIIFFGDKTFKGGNDYELASALKEYSNTDVVQVNSPKDLENILFIK